MKVLIAALVILAIACLTGVIIYTRIEPVAGAEDIAAKGLTETRRLFTFAFSAAAIIFGAVVALVFVLIHGRWPTAAQPLIFWAGVGLTVLFSIGAAVVRSSEGAGGIPECVALNALWGLGYGWLLPLVIG